MTNFYLFIILTRYNGNWISHLKTWNLKKKSVFNLNFKTKPLLQNTERKNERNVPQGPQFNDWCPDGIRAGRRRQRWDENDNKPKENKRAKPFPFPFDIYPSEGNSGGPNVALWWKQTGPIKTINQIYVIFNEKNHFDVRVALFAALISRNKSVHIFSSLRWRFYTSIIWGNPATWPRGLDLLDRKYALEGQKDSI